MTADVVVLGSRRLQGLSLLLTLVVVLANLGVPGLDARAALHGLLVIVGYSLARAVHTSVRDGSWRVPLVIGMAGRVLPTVLVTVALVDLYRRFATSTSISFHYLTPVAVVAAIGLLAPWLLTIGQRRLGQLRRSVVLLTVAGAVAVGGLVSVEVLTEASAVLVGLALGTFPLASLHRHPPTRLVWPAALGLIGLIAAPDIGLGAVDVGVRLALVALAMSVLTAADIVGSLPARLSGPLSSPPVHRLASRSFGLYLWHVPFFLGLAGGQLGQWAGWVECISVLVLSLAAAITTYRRIELPAQTAIRRLAGRWFDEDAVVPPALKACERQLVKWDELRFDRLASLPRAGGKTARSTMGRLRPVDGQKAATDIDLRTRPRPPLPQRPPRARQVSRRPDRDDDRPAEAS